MSEIVVPADLATQAANRLRDRMRQVLVESIPDEEMDKLIQAEKKAYFEAKPAGRDTWGNATPAQPSPFQKKVCAEIEAQLTPKIESRVRDAVNTIVTEWDHENGQQMVIKSIIDEMAPKIMDSILQGFAHRALVALKNG